MQTGSENGQQNIASGNEELLDRAIAEYLRAESTGQPENRQEWLDRYPECAAGLVEFFEDRKRLDRIVTPMRSERPAGRENDRSASSDSDASAVHIDTVDFVPTPPHFAAAKYRPLKFHARG